MIALQNFAMSYIRLFLFLLSVQFSYSAAAQHFSIPSKVKRIVFIGNSITYAGKYVTDVEAYLVARYPDKKYEIINVGLPSETVSGLSEEGHAGGRFPRPDVHERLHRILQQTRPDLVFVNYGMNDGIYLPFNEERFQKFREGMNWIHLEVERWGALIVHLTPPIYDAALGNANGYAEVLDRYAEWLLAQQKEQNWKVADIHFAMKARLENERQMNPDFTFAKDAVHPDDSGHWLMAQQLLLYLGENQVADCPSVQDCMLKFTNGAELYKLVAERQAITKDSWLTAIGHTRPEMAKGIPLKEAKKKWKEIQRKIRQLQGMR